MYEVVMNGQKMDDHPKLVTAYLSKDNLILAREGVWAGSTADRSHEGVAVT